MRSADLVLVRHARCVPVSDLAPDLWTLAPGAMEETAALGLALARVRLERRSAPGVVGGIDTVVASREAKAVATARSLAHALQAELSTYAGLEEHHRSKAGLLPQEDFESAMRRLFSSPEELVFGDETAEEAGERMRVAVVSLLEGQPEKRLAVVSHGTVIALLLAAANSLEPHALWSSLAMPEALVVRSSDWRILERLKVEQ